MDAQQTIMQELEEIFAPMDAEVLASTHKWAEGRRQALQEFKQSDEYQAMRRDQWRLYEHMFAMCGGKTWYNAFTCGSSAEYVDKYCAAAAKARNARIAAKLERAGVSEVLSRTFDHTTDGFHGWYGVRTDRGDKRISIRTISAGGHNIQCLHLRVLVSIK